MPKKLLKLEILEIPRISKPFEKSDYRIGAWFDFKKDDVFWCQIEKDITKKELAAALQTLVDLLLKHAED